jgi:hypothetical protein
LIGSAAEERWGGARCVRLLCCVRYKCSFPFFACGGGALPGCFRFTGSGVFFLCAVRAGQRALCCVAAVGAWSRVRSAVRLSAVPPPPSLLHTKRGEGRRRRRQQAHSRIQLFI